MLDLHKLSCGQVWIQSKWTTHNGTRADQTDWTCTDLNCGLGLTKNKEALKTRTGHKDKMTWVFVGAEVELRWSWGGGGPKVLDVSGVLMELDQDSLRPQGSVCPVWTVLILEDVIVQSLWPEHFNEIRLKLTVADYFLVITAVSQRSPKHSQEKTRKKSYLWPRLMDEMMFEAKFHLVVSSWNLCFYLLCETFTITTTVTPPD